VPKKDRIIICLGFLVAVLFVEFVTLLIIDKYRSWIENHEVILNDTSGQLSFCQGQISQILDETEFRQVIEVADCNRDGLPPRLENAVFVGNKPPVLGQPVVLYRIVFKPPSSDGLDLIVSLARPR